MPNFIVTEGFEAVSGSNSTLGHQPPRPGAKSSTLSPAQDQQSDQYFSYYSGSRNRSIHLENEEHAVKPEWFVAYEEHRGITDRGPQHEEDIHQGKTAIAGGGTSVGKWERIQAKPGITTKEGERDHISLPVGPGLSPSVSRAASLQQPPAGGTLSVVMTDARDRRDPSYSPSPIPVVREEATREELEQSYQQSSGRPPPPVNYGGTVHIEDTSSRKVWGRPSPMVPTKNTHKQTPRKEVVAQHNVYVADVHDAEDLTTTVVSGTSPSYNHQPVVVTPHHYHLQPTRSSSRQESISRSSVASSSQAPPKVDQQQLRNEQQQQQQQVQQQLPLQSQAVMHYATPSATEAELAAALQQPFDTMSIAESDFTSISHRIRAMRPKHPFPLGKERKNQHHPTQGEPRTFEEDQAAAEAGKRDHIDRLIKSFGAEAREDHAKQQQIRRHELTMRREFDQYQAEQEERAAAAARTRRHDVDQQEGRTPVTHNRQHDPLIPREGLLPPEEESSPAVSPSPGGNARQLLVAQGDPARERLAAEGLHTTTGGATPNRAHSAGAAALGAQGQYTPTPMEQLARQGLLEEGIAPSVSPFLSRSAGHGGGTAAREDDRPKPTPTPSRKERWEKGELTPSQWRESFLSDWGATSIHFKRQSHRVSVAASSPHRDPFEKAVDEQERKELQKQERARMAEIELRKKLEEMRLDNEKYLVAGSPEWT